MKRIFAVLLIFTLITAALSGCARTANKNSEEKLNIVCTAFPQYDWVRQIIKSENVTLLTRNGIDLHSYQPSADDIVKISACDIFIYTGGESDGWVGDALKEATNKNMIVLNLLDVLGGAAKTEDVIEGMESEEHGEEYDEHIWLSLVNAKTLCSAIAEALSSLDSGSAASYGANLNDYLSNLEQLHEQYSEFTASAPVKTLLFGDRFPFRYLLDDYGLSYYAAFPGCSAETEASFETIVFLAKKADELNLRTIMVTESSDKSIAETIRDNTKDKNQQILVLNAMQSVTSDGIQSGTTYLSVMESNLNVLKEALR